MLVSSMLHGVFGKYFDRSDNVDRANGMHRVALTGGSRISELIDRHGRSDRILIL